MVIFVAPVSHCVELALFAVDFSGKFPKYVAAVPHLHSIHPSITRESKWRYIMKKINLRELSRKIDNKKRQLPVMGNRRDKNTYYSADLDRMIMLIGSHTSPEEGQGFF